MRISLETMDAYRQINPGVTPPPDTSPHEHEARLQRIIDTGLALGGEHNLDTIVQIALDAARELVNAGFGVFFYTAFGSDGTPVQLYKLSAQDPEVLSGIHPLPIADHFRSSRFQEAFRSADITQNLNFGGNSPFSGTPLGYLDVHSYLSVPVRTPTGDTLGGMLFGHPDPDLFTAYDERQATIIAAQVCASIQNARLSETLTQEIAIADAARLAQRETAQRLASVFESTTDGVYLIDRNWRFTYINDRAEALLAEGRDLVGQNIWEAFPEAVNGPFYNRYHEAMDHGRPGEITDLYAPLDLWVYVRVFPTPEGIAVFFQDVTESRKLESAGSEANRRLRQALDAAELGTWTWNRETDLLDLDDRANFLLDGEGPHTPISRTELRKRIVHEDDLGQTAENMRDIFLAGGAYNVEYRVETRDGRQYWISSRGIPVFSDQTTAPESGKDPSTRLKEMTGMIGTVQDITARKTQEAALRQSEKLAATGRLAATIAHEINNPLEAVTNLIYLSKTDPGIPPPIAHLLETADSELARVAQIAQQTLGFYRDTTRPVDIDLTNLLEGVADLFSRKMQYKKLKCKVEVEPDLHIFGLQGEVRQVFSNLLVNAIDASFNGIIRMRARRSSRAGRSGVSVVIADSGSGIPLAVRNRLFSPFFTTKQSTGTGLGLWVTRGIIEKQGGVIGFRTSTANPSGTVFRIFLPAEFLSPDKFTGTESRFLQ